MGASRLRIDEFESDGNIKSGELEGIDLLFECSNRNFNSKQAKQKVL